VHAIDIGTKKQTHEDHHLNDPNSRELLHGLLLEADQQSGPAPESPLEILGRYLTTAACKCFELLKKLLGATWDGVKYIIRTIDEL
jgi:hypothetical protein